MLFLLHKMEEVSRASWSPVKGIYDLCQQLQQNTESLFDMEHTFSGQQIWQQYTHSGGKALKTLSPHSAFEAFYLACLAFGEEEFALAAEHARAAAKQDSGNLVFRHAACYLQQVLQDEKTDVYIDGEAFAAFIRGGSNRLLYERTSAALHTIYGEYEQLSVLDAGVGDGLALLPALHESIRHLSVLDPSETLLQQLCDALDQRGTPPYQAIHSTLQDFIGTCSEHWDLIESTFCLHSIEPKERREILTWMRTHGKRLLLAEFDVPDFPDMYAPERVLFLMKRYEKGLAEYDKNAEFVAQGFLMPVLLGNFDRTRARRTYEQPLEHWRADLKTAGYRSVTCEKLYPYWWSTAYLIDAS